MNYSIAPVDINNLCVAGAVTRLVNASFDTRIDDDRIRRNTATTGEAPSLYLAAKIGDEIIGFNAFIAHRLFLNGAPLLAYQSCWTATSDAHRGKKIFQNLINAGRDEVKSRGGSFLFGFPNANSRPIFVNKLGFRETGSLKWQVPNLPLLMRNTLAPMDHLAGAEAITQDDEQLIALKRLEHGGALLVVESEGGRCWGIRRFARRLGIPIPVFEIGGLSLAHPRHLSSLMNKVRARCGAAVLQMVTVEGNRYNPMFNRTQPVLPPFIIDDLGLDTQGLRFDFFGGIRDYY